MFIKYINPTLFRLDITIPRNYYIQSSSIFLKNNTFFFKFILFMNLWLNFKLKKLNYYLIKFNLFQKNKNLILYCSIFSKNLLELQRKKNSWYMNKLSLKSFKKRSFYKQHIYNILKNKMLNMYLEKAILKFIPNKPFKIYLQNILFKHLFSISNTATTTELNFYKNIYMKYFFYNLLIKLENNFFLQKKKEQELSSMYFKYVKSRYKLKSPKSYLQTPTLFLMFNSKEVKKREIERLDKRKKLRLARLLKLKHLVPNFNKKFKNHLRYNIELKTIPDVKKFYLLKQYRSKVFQELCDGFQHQRPEKFKYTFYQHVYDKLLSTRYKPYRISQNWWFYVWSYYKYYKNRRTSLKRIRINQRHYKRNYSYLDLKKPGYNFFKHFQNKVFKTYRYAVFLLFNYVRLNSKFPPKRKEYMRRLSSKPTVSVASSKLALRFFSASPKNMRLAGLGRSLKLSHYPFSWSQLNRINSYDMDTYELFYLPRARRPMRKLIFKHYRAQRRFAGTQLKHIYRRRPGSFPKFQYTNPWDFFFRRATTVAGPEFIRSRSKYFVYNQVLTRFFKQPFIHNASNKAFVYLNKQKYQPAKFTSTALKSLFYSKVLRSKKLATSRQIYWVNKEIIDLKDTHKYNPLKRSVNDLYAINKTLFLPFYSCLFITQRLPYRLRRSRRFFYNSLVKLLLYGFLEKAPSLIFSFIELFFQNSKRHVQLLKSFNSFFYIFFKLKFITETCNIEGLKIIIKGKFNGRRRKRFFILNFGKTSFQDSSIPVYHYSDQLITYTGIFGVRISLFCKKRIYDVRKF